MDALRRNGYESLWEQVSCDASDTVRNTADSLKAMDNTIREVEMSRMKDSVRRYSPEKEVRHIVNYVLPVP